MKGIFLSSEIAENLRQGLSEPDKQWKLGYSAHALAYCWLDSNGFPAEIARLFSDASIKESAFHNIEPLIALSEYKVSIPPKDGRPSQNDLFVVAKGSQGLISIMVEGKVKEPFGETIGEWLKNASPGKIERLQFLKQQLGLTDVPSHIRYQLLHRTVSAILEADRFHAKTAVMIVHSFSPDNLWLEDYIAFCQLFGVAAHREQLSYLTMINGISLYCGWATGDSAYLIKCNCEASVCRKDANFDLKE